MNPHRFILDVHIFDTDCYGVMWHGAYAKWLEMGRVDFLKAQGMHLRDLSDHHDIIFPVVEQTLKYKASARFGDTLEVTTQLHVQEPRLLFSQTFRNTETDKITLEALTTVVLINSSGKVYRKLPDVLSHLLFMEPVQ